MNIILLTEDEACRPLDCRDPRAIHLLKVLRKGPGDEFDAGLLGGKRGKGVITGIEAGGVSYRLELTEPPPARLAIEVGLGFPRPIQLRRILRELSNMGVAVISLFGADLGEKSYRDTRLIEDGGARAALIEGAVQGRDTTLPELRVFPDLAGWLAGLMPGAGWRVVADNVQAEGHFADDLGPAPDGVTLAIGSERGWSDRERALFRAAGFQSRSLGARALRTETAAAAAVAFASVKVSAN